MARKQDGVQQDSSSDVHSRLYLGVSNFACTYLPALMPCSLGDRHCENILLDTNSGDAVHVDFSCLFEKVRAPSLVRNKLMNHLHDQGKLLEIPERVPFRLTQNLVDGLGVTGVDGVFRIACEITMNLLRENKDCLMNVLDAFIHDPLVEWEDEKRRRDAEVAQFTCHSEKWC